MDFVTAIKTCLSKYATFTGRARRSEFWFFVLFQVLLGIGASIIDAGFFGRSPYEPSPFGALVNLALLLPALAVHVRRLHDKDYSGWWLLLYFVPVIGWLVLLVWFCQRGTIGSNRFGDDPIHGAAANAIT
jgi:uncharacterized membrane protein YhaH (DUF805 family)